MGVTTEVNVLDTVKNVEIFRKFYFLSKYEVFFMDTNLVLNPLWNVTTNGTSTELPSHPQPGCPHPTTSSVSLTLYRICRIIFLTRHNPFPDLQTTPFLHPRPYSTLTIWPTLPLDLGRKLSETHGTLPQLRQNRTIRRNISSRGRDKRSRFPTRRNRGYCLLTSVMYTAYSRDRVSRGFTFPDVGP